MPPKKKRAVAAAKAPAIAMKTPPASPSKPASSSPSQPSSPSPTRKPSSHNATPQHGSTPPSAEKNRRQSPSARGTDNTPKRASPSQPPRTPQNQGSQGHPSAHQQNQRSRNHDGATSPSVPPAPATTPVPVSESTPRRVTRHSESLREASSGTGRMPSMPLHSASPVPPPPPPTTPVPVAKRSSSQQQQSTPSNRKSCATSVHGSTPLETKKNAMKTTAAGLTSAAAAAAADSVASTPQNVNNGGKGGVGSNGGDAQKATMQKPLSRGARRQRSRHDESEPSLFLPPSHAVEHYIRESKVIAPDVSGIRCIAVHPSEQHVAVARENGSLVLYDVSFFQNIPQFVQRRHTGGQTRRTISSLIYVAVPPPPSTSTSSSSTTTDSTAQATPARYVLLASMMSGQIVLYDAELLVPVALHQRSGGAIWQLTAINPSSIYAAMADGSWQQLRLTCKRDNAAPQLELVRVVPGISGADRALTVATSHSLRMAVGTDDAGNVHAWRLPAASRSVDDNDAGDNTSAGRSRGLAEHESLWTTKLAKGFALSCAVVGSTQRPCVVVGTSMGDVVLLDAAHGHVFQTFSQHKGPVTTLVVQNDAVIFASGWHESLRSYRCNSDGDWYPAEVKRRTHYHEASQLALMPRRQLMLSASRDGTIMYSPIAQLFHSPAMYVPVTTQQFAFAAGRSLLLQSRFDTIEVFGMDGASRHWVPFFGHRLEGRFHLSGLWCDERLQYILFSTEERLGLLKVVWRVQAAMSIARIEEVLELPARTGVVDVCWRETAPANDSKDKDSENEEAAGDAAGALPTTTAGAPRVLYVLYDDCVTSVTLAEGYPMVDTAVQVRGKGLPADSLRPYRVFCRPTSGNANTSQKSDASASSVTTETAYELVIYGHRGSCRIQLMEDGTPDAGTLVADLDDVYELVHEVPALDRRRVGIEDDDDRRAKKAKGEAADVEAAISPASLAPSALIGLSLTQQRYIAGSTLHSSAVGATPLPATLPHDVKWIARIPASSSSAYKYLGYFSRGLLVAAGDTWHMVRRMNVEAAFVVREGTEVLVLERNLEKTLEALPLSWKVRRFGN
ncbi:hypothetical protein ABL78_7244 [Leptomonas seymouri]|uniref:Uncharacterized protein n=1 Tax=Leptomonas seymouri TaxID=5684 RepID=A0A0N1PBC9_LEPSE|nr:hypothetical protein ABL78_7244 [Leptomonas seymouri]|eukprot:KPI83712.1 hypothetical protein ABL78_7244 [Leptomonas seymouri]